MALSPMIFAPGENAPCGFFYVINRGVALYRGGMLVKGQTWGHDFILLTPLFRNFYQARALNYLEVFFLAREDMMAAAEAYPTAYRRIRWWAVRLALLREAKRLSNLKRADERKDEKRGLAPKQRTMVDVQVQRASPAVGMLGVLDRQPEVVLPSHSGHTMLLVAGRSSSPGDGAADEPGEGGVSAAASEALRTLQEGQAEQSEQLRVLTRSVTASLEKMQQQLEVQARRRPPPRPRPRLEDQLQDGEASCVKSAAPPHPRARARRAEAGDAHPSDAKADGEDTGAAAGAVHSGARSAAPVLPAAPGGALAPDDSMAC